MLARVLGYSDLTQQHLTCCDLWRWNIAIVWLGLYRFGDFRAFCFFIREVLIGTLSTSANYTDTLGKFHIFIRLYVGSFVSLLFSLFINYNLFLFHYFWNTQQRRANSRIRRQVRQTELKGILACKSNWTNFEVSCNSGSKIFKCTSWSKAYEDQPTNVTLNCATLIVIIEILTRKTLSFLS